MIVYKPSVFVSSTVWDLASERKAAEIAISKIGGHPLISEKTFIAENKNPLKACTDQVKQSDIYILLLGGRYGYELENGKSVTELEWDTACSQNKPRLVFNLKYITKEDKQEEFAKQVGHIFYGRFWKEVNDAFELSSEIELSLRNLISEEKLNKKKNSEKLYSSLMGLQLPNEIYQADLDIDRDEIISLSKDGPNFLKKNADSRRVIFEGLRQKELKFSADWTTYKGRILTFHNLKDSKLPIVRLIDKGTVVSITPKEFWSANEDLKNIFKGLLRHCLRQKLYRLKIEWLHDDEIFRFMPITEDLATRRESWQANKKATRKVFEKIEHTYKEKLYLYCKHFAFRVGFVDIEDKWFVSVMPDWSFSWDSKRKDFKEAERISWLKRNERNQQVFNHFKFLYAYLREADNDLYGEQYPFIRFQEIFTVNGHPHLNDLDWLKKEDSALQSKLLDNKDQIIMDL
ncbi:MAG: DUF4062 domain-containing protein [Bacteroidetes bacterium]|nr:DUF4062 domain-containing protein [Bacteroidota bacterium]